MPLPPHAHDRYAPGFVMLLLEQALADRGTPYAIAGLQGTGKSTVGAQIAEQADQLGVRATVLSIDDFYLDRPERIRLGRDVHPLLATRGPPGTHDVALACDTIDGLLAGRPTPLPRFDKFADERLPESRWPLADGCELVIFEGWFLKVPAETDAAREAPLNALERDEDPDSVWRRHCNTSLARDYTPLWHRLPRLLFLQAPRFEVVPDWRWQQECTLQAANPGRAAMTRPQVEHFVQLFERVSRQALRTLPSIAQSTIRLDASRRAEPVDIASLKSTSPAAPTINA